MCKTSNAHCIGQYFTMDFITKKTVDIIVVPLSTGVTTRRIRENPAINTVSNR